MDARLTVSYLGTAYAGWQRQENAVAVQQRLEEALERLVGHPVRTVGAGRTDAGVHARGQVVSCRLARAWPSRALVHGTNHHLPPDIRVLAAMPAPTGFDARRDAVWKEYRYRFDQSPVLSPLDAATTASLPRQFDLGAVREAAARLVGRHDFAAFANAGGSHGSSMRSILLACWTDQGPRHLFRVRGDGFLRGMVRTLVGTLVEVGSGRRDPADMGRLLGGARRDEAGPTAPAHGLVLHQVLYRGDETAGEAQPGHRKDAPGAPDPLW